jgi:hypothetical protein
MAVRLSAALDPRKVAGTHFTLRGARKLTNKALSVLNDEV